MAPSASQQSQFHNLEDTPQIPRPTLAGNRSSSSDGQALADPISQASFPVQCCEPRDQPTSEFLPGSDEGHTGTVSAISGSTLAVDTHYDSIEPLYLPHGAGLLNQQVQNNPGTHYDFNGLTTQDSKTGRRQIDQNPQFKCSSSPICASEPPLHELVYHSDTREVASALLKESFQGNANWPMYFPQHNSSPSKLNSYMLSQSVPITSGHELPPRLEDCSWEEGNKAEITSQAVALHQQKKDLGIQTWVAQENLPSITIQYHDATPLGIKEAGLVASVRSDNQKTETSYPSEEDVFDKSDDDVTPDESDQDTQADFGKAQEDHLQNNDLGIIVALQASQDMKEQRLRTYHSFLDGPNVLTSYQPSARSSPLNDSTAAQIFYHYVNVTGPSISLYERHPANPSLMFQGRPIPRSQQHIWACTRIHIYLITLADSFFRHDAYACLK